MAGCCIVAGWGAHERSAVTLPQVHTGVRRCTWLKAVPSGCCPGAQGAGGAAHGDRRAGSQRAVHDLLRGVPGAHVRRALQSCTLKTGHDLSHKGISTPYHNPKESGQT